MSLLNSLLSTAGALRAFEQVLEVTQNNVANASTPGFAKQRLSLQAMPLDLGRGAAGGVRAAEIQSSRDEYSEQSVRRQTVLLGHANQKVDSLSSVESVFDISGEGGIPGALNDLLQSFSAWAQLPNDSVTRQNVIERATGLAQSFRQTSGDLANVASDSERQIEGTVNQINRLASELRDFNVTLMRGDHDPAVDARIHAALEELSQYIPVTALRQDDGSITVLLGGQPPLVVADRTYPIGYRLEEPGVPAPVNPSAPPVARISSADGADITAKVTEGKLGALLDFRNTVIPSYIGDSYRPGDINRMAQQFADRVNELLTSGNISDGPPPVPGVPLFTYDATKPTSVASTLAINPAIDRTQLAAISPGPVANGIPLALSLLTNSPDPADRIDGATYSQFYGDMAARTGRVLNDARTRQEVQQSAVAQAKDLREQMSAVSLDEEATIMIQFQRAYEANSRMLSILDQLTRDIIDILRP